MKLLLILITCLATVACARKDSITESVTYTITYQSESVKGSVSEVCHNYESRPSQKCLEKSNIVYKIGSYMCDLSGKLFVISNSENIAQDGVSCTRSFKKESYTSKYAKEKKYV